jgi:cytochrome b561
MEAPHLTPAMVGIAIALPLIAWRVYRRVRRMIGRQRSKAWRHWTAAVFFPLLLGMLALGALARPAALAILAAAVAVGLGLAMWGLSLTRFERTPEGIFYTPNAHIGIALSLLLVARVLYRMFEIATLPLPRGGAGMQDFARSPRTLVVLGMLASYYAAYAVGVLLHRHRLRQVPGLVDVGAAKDGRVVGEELKRDRVHDR